MTYDTFVDRCAEEFDSDELPFLLSKRNLTSKVHKIMLEEVHNAQQTLQGSVSVLPLKYLQEKFQNRYDLLQQFQKFAKLSS